MIKFEYQHDETSEKVIIVLPADSTLTEVLEAFDRFLKCATYHYDGVVDIVDDAESWVMEPDDNELN